MFLKKETTPPRRPIRILTVADEPSKKYYDYYTPGVLKGVDLILSCGDLPKSYLEFLVTMANCPLYYVRGNHDDGLEENPPEGCECIEDRIVEFEGIRILGLGGSYRYRSGRNMYTDFQMYCRVWRLLPSIRRKGVDIVLTHAPAKDVNDFDNLSHRGFAVFRELMEKYYPAYLIHGHIHMNYGMKIPRKTTFSDTIVINAYEAMEIEFN